MRTPSVKNKQSVQSESGVAVRPTRNNDNRTPTHCGGNTRHGPTRGEALHALASSRRCARWSVATAPPQRPCTITKHNDKALAARCARGVEGKGERLSPTYLEQCQPLGGQNDNIGLRCLWSSSGTPWLALSVSKTGTKHEQQSRTMNQMVKVPRQFTDPFAVT